MMFTRIAALLAVLIFGGPALAQQPLVPKTIFAGLPDLKAEAINFSVVTRISAHKADIKVTGVVRNVGQSVFQAKPGVLASVVLWENNSKREIKQFSKVLTGDTVTVEFVRKNWIKPVMGGPIPLPTTFKLEVIYLGVVPGMPKSGTLDANLENNLMTRSGSAINNLF